MRIGVCWKRGCGEVEGDVELMYVVSWWTVKEPINRPHYNVCAFYYNNEIGIYAFQYSKLFNVPCYRCIYMWNGEFMVISFFCRSVPCLNLTYAVLNVCIFFFVSTLLHTVCTFFGSDMDKISDMNSMLSLLSLLNACSICERSINSSFSSNADGGTFFCVCAKSVFVSCNVSNLTFSWYTTVCVLFCGIRYVLFRMEQMIGTKNNVVFEVVERHIFSHCR